MQTATENMLQDFERHPIGTGAELARLSDQVRALADALAEYQECIDATGGLYQWDNGQSAPLADTDWTDLGAAYKLAQAALKAVGR